MSIFFDSISQGKPSRFHFRRDATVHFDKIEYNIDIFPVNLQQFNKIQNVNLKRQFINFTRYVIWLLFPLNILRETYTCILQHHIFQNGKSTILYSDNVFHKYILMWKIFLEIIKSELKFMNVSTWSCYRMSIFMIGMWCHVRALDCVVVASC